MTRVQEEINRKSADEISLSSLKMVNTDSDSGQSQCLLVRIADALQLDISRDFQLTIRSCVSGLEMVIKTTSLQWSK